MSWEVRISARVCLPPTFSLIPSWALTRLLLNVPYLTQTLPTISATTYPTAFFSLSCSLRSKAFAVKRHRGASAHLSRIPAQKLQPPVSRMPNSKHPSHKPNLICVNTTYPSLTALNIRKNRLRAGFMTMLVRTITLSMRML